MSLRWLKFLDDLLWKDGELSSESFVAVEESESPPQVSEPEIQFTEQKLDHPSLFSWFAFQEHRITLSNKIATPDSNRTRILMKYFICQN